MTKVELRENMIRMLNNHSDTEKYRYEQEILNTLIKTDLWKNAKRIGITVSQGFEWETKDIIEKAWKQNKQICVPKCHPTTKAMSFYKLDSFDQLEVVYYNLKEPKVDQVKYVPKNDIDLLIVPGLVYNREGYRIGFGGGFYDRFLVDFKNTTLSLLHPDQIVNQLPIDTYDMKVDYLLSADGFIKK